MHRSTGVILMAMAVLASRGPAQEGQDQGKAEEVLARLRKQWETAPAIRATYRVRVTRADNRTSLYDVKYLREGQQFDILEYTLAGAVREGKSLEVFDGMLRRTTDGTNVWCFTDDGDPQRRCSGWVRTLAGDNSTAAWKSENDLTAMAGWFPPPAWFDEHQSRFTFKNLGADTVGGVRCVQIQMITPYRPGLEAHNHYWIAEDPSGLRLLRYRCFIDGDPRKKIVDRECVYPDAADSQCASLLPKSIKVERWDFDESSGRVRFNERRELTVSASEVGIGLDPSAFRFSFPAGTFVTDLPAGTAYVMGFSGDKLSTQLQPIRDEDVIRKLEAF